MKSKNFNQAAEFFKEGIRLDHYLTKKSINLESDAILIHHANYDEKSQTEFSVFSHYFFSQLAIKFRDIVSNEIRPFINDLEDEQKKDDLINKTNAILENLYKEICGYRIAIANKTSKFLELSKADEINLKYQLLNNLTYTIISEGSNYLKYSTKIQERDIKSPLFLSINACLTALDEKTEEQDLIIGMLHCKKQGSSKLSVEHIMNFHLGFEYIKQERVDLQNTIIDQQNFIKKSNDNIEENRAKVDKVTTLSFLKSIHATNNNNEKALKYALVFNVLRGHNLRSVIGACWAQEMSTRILFNEINQRYFNKTPDTFLDIEACCQEFGGDIEVLSKMLDQQVSEIANKNDPNISRMFFDFDQQLPYESDINSYQKEMDSCQKLENNFHLIDNGEPNDIANIINQQTSFSDLFKKDFEGRVFIFEIFRKLKSLANISLKEESGQGNYQVIFGNLINVIQLKNYKNDQALEDFYLPELVEFLATELQDDANDFIKNLAAISFNENCLENEKYKIFSIKSAVESSDTKKLEKILNSDLFFPEDFNLAANEDKNLSLFEFSVRKSIENNDFEILEKIFSCEKLDSKILKGNKFKLFELVILDFEENFNVFFEDKSAEYKKDFHTKITKIILDSNLLSNDDCSFYNSRLSMPLNDGYYQPPENVSKMIGEYFKELTNKKNPQFSFKNPSATSQISKLYQTKYL